MENPFELIFDPLIRIENLLSTQRTKESAGNPKPEHELRTMDQAADFCACQNPLSIK
jgi:hypothetical protein